MEYIKGREGREEDLLLPGFIELIGVDERD